MLCGNSESALQLLPQSGTAQGLGGVTLSTKFEQSSMDRASILAAKVHALNDQFFQSVSSPQPASERDPVLNKGST